MKPISFLIGLLLLSMNVLNAQESLNNYKYVIIPENYDFLKTADQYQLNSLTKFLFTKEGFETLFDTDITPRALAENPCSALKARVTNNSTMFVTKLVVELLSCQNEVVFKSMEGRSKLKDFKKGYHEALRGAFQSISAKKYIYNPTENQAALAAVENAKEAIVDKAEEVVADKKMNEVKKEAVNTRVNEADSETNIKEKESKKTKEREEKSSEDVSETSAKKVSNELNEKKTEKLEKQDEKKSDVKEEKAVMEEKRKKLSEQGKTTSSKEKSAAKTVGNKVVQAAGMATAIKASNILLYAQETPLGYQLVNSTPELVFILIKSSKEDLYILKNKQGFVFKENDNWFAEYFDGEQVIKEAIQIKF